jgi:hypothetical protein
MSIGASNCIIAAGANYNGSAWVAKSTAASRLAMDTGAYDFACNTGLTAGTSFTPTTRMTITAGGLVGIGISPVHLLQLGADDAAKPGTTTWTVVSDARLKRNVEPFTEGLTTLLGLRPVRYEYNGEYGTPEGLRGVGVIAQEAQAVYAPFIRRAPGKIAGQDTDVLSTNVSDLTWMMVNALRELNERLKKLEKVISP